MINLKRNVPLCSLYLFLADSTDVNGDAKLLLRFKGQAVRHLLAGKRKVGVDISRSPSGSPPVESLLPSFKKPCHHNIIELTEDHGNSGNSIELIQAEKLSISPFASSAFVLQPGQQVRRRVPAPHAAAQAIANGFAHVNEGFKGPKWSPNQKVHADTGLAPIINPNGVALTCPGSIIWGKLGSHPWWPAQVQQPAAEQKRLKHSEDDLFCVFYGSGDFSWISRKDIKPFSASLPEYTKYAARGKNNKSLSRAIDSAWAALGKPRPDHHGMPHG